MSLVRTASPRSFTIAQENARFMSRVYRWMSLGLMVTSFVAYGLSQSPELVAAMYANRPVIWGLIALQLGAVFFLSAAIHRVRALTAMIVFLGYAALTGLTLSSLFFTYTFESITSVFLVTTFAFAGLSGFGLVTRRDLGPVGTFCAMGLFGLIGFYVLSFFFPSLGMGGQTQRIASFFGVIIFAGLTAYDTQRIKAMNLMGNEGTEEDTKEAIHGALTLYLDFINLFLALLRLRGDRRR